MNKILVSSVLASLLFVACGDEKKTLEETTHKVEQKKIQVEKKSSADKIKEATSDISKTVSKASSEVADTVSKAGSEVMEKGKEIVKNVSDTVSKEVKDKATKMVEDTKESISKASSSLVDGTKEVVNKTVEKTTEVVKDVKESASNAVASTVASVAKPSVDGKALFAACASCHGQKAEKKALGKSEVIAGWDKQKVIDALNGYKVGTYGGAMKGLMKGQVASKSQADIDALAGYISTLK